jgi:hypothetical protein
LQIFCFILHSQFMKFIGTLYIMFRHNFETLGWSFFWIPEDAMLPSKFYISKLQYKWLWHGMENYPPHQQLLHCNYWKLSTIQYLGYNQLKSWTKSGILNIP